jgi:type II secretory pathway pseudopilin PulG
MISPFTKCRQGGFTLIEIIGSLLIAAILGAIMFQYFGTSLTQSTAPIDRLKKALQLQQILENITEDYESSDKSSTYLETTLMANIGAEGTDQNNTYGEYHVVNNHFIKFVGQVEAPATGGDPKDILKVTIQNDIDEILAVLFTAQ